MKAEDTVINFGGVYDECGFTKEAKSIALAQAEISFKAGYKLALEGAVMKGGYESVKKVGMREVVEFIEEREFLCTNTKCLLSEDYSKGEWQAFLKEQGL